MLSLLDFDYQLPSDRIAQVPLEQRDHSKLLCVDRTTKSLTDLQFKDLGTSLGSTDVLVLNNTKVLPARLFATTQTGKTIEILLEKEVSQTSDSITFECLSKPGLREGAIAFLDSNVQVRCTAVLGYTRHLQFSIPREAFFELLYRIGHTPIPPYIAWEETDEMSLRTHYQTVYASKIGAVAAPTAGLHFTPELLKKLQATGVQIEEVTLHVGLGTFLPVKTNNIDDHHMHSERYVLSDAVAARLNTAKEKGKRIIAVGTTSVRVLETCADSSGKLHGGTGETQIFIYPPYKFKVVDSLITNFHTPKSTLLMLIAAFVSSPNTTSYFERFQSSLIGAAYHHALEHGYRFYSFGDAMWIQ
ncbi:tRNA preQ1(34) S-adenosylmethionine ribosyltransferase-isomerase QueA [Candidatus Woesebacteria bacterium]|nr:tRNA preQ1(34) S-adenosylmethionine ribosyltransferase-isomerase QueA [Candidatus Woesebacteria bacterium]